MNIFYLDEDPVKCAQMHCDKHVVKMVIEYAQMLSSAHRLLDGATEDSMLYRVAHKNHPCTIWCRECSGNYEYLYNLFVALCDEYTYRYGKVHLTDKKLRELLATPPDNIKEGSMTELPQAMPDDSKHELTKEAYFQYYRNHKKPFAKWTKRETPTWMNYEPEASNP